jgi:hypothetical protein
MKNRRFLMIKVLRTAAVALIAAGSLAATLQAQPQPVFSGATHSLVIPVAGDVIGVGGTRFRTDVVVANLRNQQQRVRVDWLPRDPATARLTEFTVLEAHSIRVINDFVEFAFGVQGIGALVLTAVNASDEPDLMGELDAFARIWSVMPGVAGTQSQSLPAVYAAQLIQSTSAVPNAVLVGMKQDAEHRTNVGIVNLDNDERSFVVTVTGNQGSPATVTVTVPGRSLNQFPLPAGVFGDLAVNISQIGGGDGLWTAYGSTINNASSDAWIAMDIHRQFLRRAEQ